MLLTDANTITKKTLKRIDKDEMKEIINVFLEKHFHLSKIYVNIKIYEKLNIDHVCGIPLYAGSGLNENEMTLVT